MNKFEVQGENGKAVEKDMMECEVGGLNLNKVVELLISKLSKWKPSKSGNIEIKEKSKR